MGLEVEVGHASSAGANPVNEDFAGCLLPGPAEESHGLIAAVADGVSAGGGGRDAAQSTVMSLLLDYFAAPATWDTTVALDRIVQAQNRWLDDHNRRRAGRRDEAATGLTTLTALVLRGHAFTIAHVGDTRAYLVRDGECAQITEDHRFDHPDMSSRLTRAIGIDDQVRVDYLQAEAHVGDCFVLVSDGVHGVLKRGRLAALAGEGSAQEASRRLVDAALSAGSTDNVTALIVRVRGLSEPQLEDVGVRRRDLPVPPRLAAGMKLDALTVVRLVADNGIHRLYQARDDAGRMLAVKTLHTSRANDPQERAMLIHEAWLATQVAGGGGQDGFVHLHADTDAQAFYFCYDWVAGRTLEEIIDGGRASGERTPIRDIVQAAVAAGRALGRLHRLGVVHRDIKPGNLHRGDDGVWRILDLGVAVSGREPRVLRALHAGTPSYMNPEQWPSDGNEAGQAADSGSDLYALGVTLYQWLAGRLPHGEVEPYQRGRFRHDPKPASRWRPDVPIWLDHIVLKAVSLDPAERFQTAEELVLALERGASRPLPAPGHTPLLARDPAILWKIATIVSALFNALLIYWLLFLPHG